MLKHTFSLRKLARESAQTRLLQSNGACSLRIAENAMEILLRNKRANGLSVTTASASVPGLTL